VAKKGIKMKKLAIILALSASSTAQAEYLYYGETVMSPIMSSGAPAIKQGENSTTFGLNAGALAENSVAIGYGSVATEANTMAVGGRKIVGVVAGVSDTDAVNVSQLKAGIVEANTYTDNTVNGAVTTLNQTIVQGDAQTLSQANAYTDSKVSTLVNNYRNEAREYTDARFNDNPHKRSSLAVAVGGYRGKHAVGAQYAYKTTQNTRIQATVAYDSKHVGYGVSGSFSW
jgi:autotransporter adhesin